MKKIGLLTFICIALLNIAAIFQSYNYLNADQFKEILNTKQPVIIVDIQDKKAFTAYHFPGSIETNAFPVKTNAQRNLLMPVVEIYQKTGHNIVIVCPRGGGGAKRTYSFLRSQGIAKEKLVILTGGIDKWPYRNMLNGR